MTGCATSGRATDIADQADPRADAPTTANWDPPLNITRLSTMVWARDSSAPADRVDTRSMTASGVHRSGGTGAFVQLLP